MIRVYHSKEAHVIILMKNRFGSGSCFGLLLESGGGMGAPDPALHKNLSSCTNFFFFFSSLSQIPFFRFQLKIRKLKKGLYAAKAYK